MSTPAHDKYRALHQALVTAPEFFGLPSKDRAACTRFSGMVASLGTDRAPAALETRVAYEAAMKEARKLVAAGKLTADLDGGGEPTAAESDTERPPADEPSAPEIEAPTGVQDGPGTPVTEYAIHPAALIFPMMTDEEMDNLVEDIRKNGLNCPITIHEGMVIDGRNRLEACRRAGVPPRFEQWKPTESLPKWIFSTNYHRRSLNDQQRAMVAGRFAMLMTAEGKERRARNLRKAPEIPDGLDPTHRDGGATEASGTLDYDREPATGSKPQETSEILEGLDPALRGKGKATDRAADLLNVSADAVKKAARVIRSGDVQLVDAVNKGTVSLDAAAAVANLPKEQQREAVKRGQVKAVARKVRQEKAAAKSKPQSKPKPKKKPADPAANGKSSVNEGDDHEAGTDEADDDDTSAKDENPLVRECHDAIDEMVRTGREVGELARVDKVLRDITAACGKVTARLRAGPMPPLP